jgi:hypothetical protein
MKPGGSALTLLGLAIKSRGANKVKTRLAGMPAESRQQTGAIAVTPNPSREDWSRMSSDAIANHIAKMRAEATNHRKAHPKGGLYDALMQGALTT